MVWYGMVWYGCPHISSQWIDDVVRTMEATRVTKVKGDVDHETVPIGALLVINIDEG
jgi:hypothetical protein